MFYQKGSLLLEVLMALFVFAFGMLALISLNTRTIQNNTEMTIRDKTYNISREFVNTLSFNPLNPVCCSQITYNCPSGVVPLAFKAEFDALCTSNKTAQVTFNLTSTPAYSLSCGGICTNMKAKGTVTIKWIFKGEPQQYTAYISNMELQ